MKILNLYAGIGGNRKLWGDEHEITAIEYDEKIAEIYKQNFPNDEVIVTDAHKYLLEHFEEFDFIWSSPPCPTHTRFNFLKMQQRDKGFKPKYPDMKLWQEIIFLQTWFKGKWVVENVKPYYKFNTDTKEQESGNHYYWCNFHITKQKEQTRGIRTLNNEDKEKTRGLILPCNLTKKFKEKILNNCVLPEQGKHIFDCAFKTKQEVLVFD